MEFILNSPEHWCFHILYDTEQAKINTEDLLKTYYKIEKDEPIPNREVKEVTCPHILWRYFLKLKDKNKRIDADLKLSDEDLVIKTVMNINKAKLGAFVISSVKIWVYLRVLDTLKISADFTN